MAIKSPKNGSRASGPAQAGFTFVEMAMAMFILSVGLLACAGLVTVAIRSNGKNKHDSSSATMAQMIVQQFISVSADTSPTLSITDCAGASHPINTTGSASGTGAALLPNGAVDFTWATGGVGAPAGYYMLYRDCATTGSISYDIRWNVKKLSPYTKLVTVGARVSLSASVGGPYFSLPVTIRTIAGEVP